MLYVILGLFFVVGLLYPLLGSKIDKQCKAYFMECLENDLYYPEAAHLDEDQMDDTTRAELEKMLEIAAKYMKNPKENNEYIKKYQIGFEVYKNENLDDLIKYLEDRHERKMQDPEYREAFEEYSKYESYDFSTKLYKTFRDAKNAKPKRSIFLKNIERIRNNNK